MTSKVPESSLGSVVATDHRLWASFLAALLITGTTRLAEAAVLAGVESLTFEAEPEEELFQLSMAAAVRANRSATTGCGEHGCQTPLPFPAELTNVLRLPVDLRECFVLRVLTGMSRERCAGLLQIEANQVERNVCESALILAELATAVRFDGVALSWERAAGRQRV
jgi:hypothetical protein